VCNTGRALRRRAPQRRPRLPGTPPAKHPRITTRRVQQHEQDSEAGEVYVPEDGPVPLSRRPRTRLELEGDGSATIYGGGPDDRPTPTPARWAEEDGQVVVRGANRVLRVVECTPTRLVIARS
jgi:hypothetical protein